MSTELITVLGAWPWPSPPTIAGAEAGLINQSWTVEVGGRPHAVLQRLNTKVFAPEVHEDIETVTAHLSERGVPTPRLLHTREGALWHTDSTGGVWRCLTHVGRDTVHRLHDPAMARSAGRLVARFHAALDGLQWEFRSVRPGFHDTDAQMERLRAVVEARGTHRLHGAVARISEEILQRWRRWDGPRGLRSRIVHGDLKISNIRFEDQEAVALIDLDTLRWGTLDAELGDALRSWCNPASEDARAARFDLGLFEAAIRGYAAGSRGSGPTEEEWASIVPGIERICLELAARFARDALEECYFGWDPGHGGRGEHNLLRAEGQLSLARAVAHAAPLAKRKLDQARATSP
jgi:Ser/Thr protein kinase RdoA (MazF antagonist)